jgi:glycosyltransferase involved in cell wall biosynthesis
MNILILTNTFTPHVGGVARSVAAFAGEYRKRGHRVLVVAPEFPDMPQDEIDVVRIPAIQNFNASDFSVVLPIHPQLSETIDAFRPDIVHSQHPFLLGMTAVRIARRRGLPLVFTHHTLYERYTHYVPGDSPALKRFAIELPPAMPTSPIRFSLPARASAICCSSAVSSRRSPWCHRRSPGAFRTGRRSAFRRQMGIPDNAFVVGHLGRLAPEKNLEFLAQAVADFLGTHPHAHFLVIGTGPSEQAMRDIFARAGLDARLHIAGVLQQQALADALHAMDVFAFASTSETQGMVLTEAMAAGLPVVALDAPGAREVVSDGQNGRLLREASPAAFAAALQWAAGRLESLRDLQQPHSKPPRPFHAPVCGQGPGLLRSTQAQESRRTRQG